MLFGFKGWILEVFIFFGREIDDEQFIIGVEVSIYWSKSYVIFRCVL